MSLETYEPDYAPQLSVEGRAVALVRIRYYKRWPQTRHSPEEPAYIEVESVMIEGDDGRWHEGTPELVQKLNEDLGEEAWEAYADYSGGPRDQAVYNPDPWYDW